MKLAHRIFDGPPGARTLLLLHGVTRNWRDWEPVLNELRREWRVVAVDHCGHGESPRTPGEYRVADYARHTVAFVRETFDQPVTICGHSLGAMVALALAADSLADAVILEDPPFHTMGRNIGGTPYHAQFAGMHDVALRGGTRVKITDGLAEIRLSASTRLGDVRDRPALEFSAECLACVDAGIFEPLVAGEWLDGFEHAAMWPKVRCPVLLLQGDPAEGGALTGEDASRAACAAANCRIVPFPLVGHQIHRTSPTRFLSVVREWAHDFALH